MARQGAIRVEYNSIRGKHEEEQLSSVSRSGILLGDAPLRGNDREARKVTEAKRGLKMAVILAAYRRYLH